MKVKWYGTATVEYLHAEGSILIDPFVPLAGSKHQVDISEYDGFSDILITHGHLDHIVNIPEIVERNPQTCVYCTATPYRTLQGKGVPEENLVLLRYGDELQVNGFQVSVYRGRHAILPKASPKQIARIIRAGNLGNLPFIAKENRICQENDETMMFLVQADQKKVLHMGSLNLRDDVVYPVGCDLLLLPYNGWEDNLPPAEVAVERLQPRSVLLHHFDNTFPPITSDLNLDSALETFGDLVRVPEYREEIEVRK